MKIKSVHAYKKHLALKRPYTIARNTISSVEIVFFEIELANGIKGIGTSSTDIEVVGEGASDTLANLQSDAVQKLAGEDIRQFPKLISEYRLLFATYPGTQAAIDIAIHDAFCQWLGIPIVDFYGRQHEKLLTSVTIGIKNVEETLEEAQEYHGRGFKALKVKTGLDADTDSERIIKLREKYGDTFHIRVDANTGYDPSQLDIFIKKTANCNIELIEQPFLPEKDENMRGFQNQKTLFAADESLKGPRSALQLAFNKYYQVFNIKLMKCGGISAAFEIADIARHADITLFWGCNDESIISITAALHAAYACPHTRYIDLDGSLDLAEDIVTNGFTIENGYMLPMQKPGLGVSFI